MLKAQSANPCDGAAFDEWPSNPDRLANATSASSASSAPPTTTSRGGAAAELGAAAASHSIR